MVSLAIDWISKATLTRNYTIIYFDIDLITANSDIKFNKILSLAIDKIGKAKIL